MLMMMMIMMKRSIGIEGDMGLWTKESKIKKYEQSKEEIEKMWNMKGWRNSCSDCHTTVHITWL